MNNRAGQLVVFLRTQEPRIAGATCVALGSCFRRSTSSVR